MLRQCHILSALIRRHFITSQAFFSGNMNALYVNSIDIVHLHGSKKEKWKHAHLTFKLTKYKRK